ncbi:MAG TPA: APC family permease [Bryobacteraceae bacterium]|nr:APC family permease [Bryobacteraceae bacterium]
MPSYVNLASAAKADVSSADAGHGLKKELGLGDLVLAQILCVVGSSWVGVAAKLGKAHGVFWLVAISLFYLPLAAVVIFLSRKMPLEGGLYQWAKSGFGEFFGFLTAWNLWVYAIFVVPTVLFVIPTDLSYLIGPAAEWLPGSRKASALLITAMTLFIGMVAIRGLGVAKWLHNSGSVLICAAYAILLCLPFFALFSGHPRPYTPLPFERPPMNWFSLAIFGQMTVGGLSGFEYVAIMAGECRSAARTVGRSVLISAPVIALMFILGTSSVLAFVGDQPINLIGPIPQTFRLAFGTAGWSAEVGRFAILLLLARAVASSSLIFTGLTRLPMTAGWDHLLPDWFTALHPRWKTPVNSILFMVALLLAMLLLSMLGVREQETMQLLQNASIVHYGLSYAVLFALPLFGAWELRRSFPGWLKAVSIAGLASSLIAVFISVYPIIAVSNRASYAAKIGGTVLLSNLIGVLIYRGRRRP